MEYSATIVEYLIYADFMVRFLSPKSNRNKYLFFTSILVCNTIITLVFNHFMIYEGALGIIRITCNFLLAFIFSKSNLFDKIFVSVITDTAVLIINYSIINIVSAVLDVKHYDLITQAGMLRFSMIFISKFLFFIFSRFMLRLKRKEKYLFNLTEWLTISIVFLMTVFVEMEVFNVIVDSGKPTDIKSALLISVSLLGINILVYILMIQISRKNAERLENAIDKMQLELYKSQINESEKQNDNLRKIRHDMKNHLQCILNLIDENDYAKAKEYIQEISENKLNFGLLIINTGNRGIDVISNVKLMECKNKNIKVTSNISKINVVTDDVDMCIILGNLFDNAIEACEKISEQSEIHFEITQKKSYINILMKNSIHQSVLENNPQLSTTKNKKLEHGIGLKSVKDVVKKYEGMIDFYEKEGYFTVDIWLLMVK